MAFLNKISKELFPLLALVSSLILAIILFPFGFIWHFFKPFYDAFNQKKNIGVIIWNFIRYWGMLIYQIWCSIKYILLRLAVAIDIMGNVVVGELLEDAITSEEKTFFMDGKTTISASVGHLEKNNKLNKFGLLFTKLLGKVFENNHSVNAYEKKLIDDKFNQERGIKN